MSVKKANKIASIAKKGNSSVRVCHLVHMLCRSISECHFVELGTSLGFLTAYAASGTSAARISTFEGETALIQRASDNWDQLNITAIQTIPGDIDQTLGFYLNNCPPIDVAYIDANHKYSALCRYVHQLLPRMAPDGIILVDDIYLSPDMHHGWKYLKMIPRISTTVDLYDLGMLLLSKKYPKKDLILHW